MTAPAPWLAPTLLKVLGQFLIVGSLVFGMVAVAYSATSLVRKRRAERDLVRRLVRDADFIPVLLDYLETVDRDGAPEDPAAVAELRAAITRELEALGGSRRLVLDALNQPSARGRVRYVEKLADEAAHALPAELPAGPPGDATPRLQVVG